MITAFGDKMPLPARPGDITRRVVAGYEITIVRLPGVEVETATTLGDLFSGEKSYVRIMRVLDNAQISSIEDLTCMTAQDLRQMNGFGALSLKAVIDRLAALGLSLSETRSARWSIGGGDCECLMKRHRHLCPAGNP